MKNFIYDATNGRFLGVVSEAHEFTTTLEPPVQAGFESRFIGGKWIVSPAPKLTDSREDLQPDAELDSAQALSILKAHALARIKIFASDVRCVASSVTDPFEAAEWPNKLRIALAHQSGAELSETDLSAFNLEIRLRARGESFDQFAKKILDKAAAASAVAAAVGGIKSNATRAIAAAKTESDVNQILRLAAAAADEFIPAVAGMEFSTLLTGLKN